MFCRVAYSFVGAINKPIISRYHDSVTLIGVIKGANVGTVDSLAMSHFKGPDVEVALPNFRPHTSVLNLLEAALRRNGDAIGMVSMFWL